MKWTFMADGETAQELSARLCRPLCMILRANRLFSDSWLLPGMEIAVPDEAFCETDRFPCPVLALAFPAFAREAAVFYDEEDLRLTAKRLGIPIRVIYALLGISGGKPPAGLKCLLPVPPSGSQIRTALPGNVIGDFALSGNVEAVRALNAIWGNVYPGMKILTV
ncbi:MAG: hypothetical protein IJC48_03965 [Clostridia bacterium]|nr:hypothetical protein [Clostridia bacterium]